MVKTCQNLTHCMHNLRVASSQGERASACVTTLAAFLLPMLSKMRGKPSLLGASCAAQGCFLKSITWCNNKSPHTLEGVSRFSNTLLSNLPQDAPQDGGVCLMIVHLMVFSSMNVTNNTFTGSYPAKTAHAADAGRHSPNKAHVFGPL